MLDLEVIKEKYQEMPIDDLIKLSKKPKDLREEVIPILQAELIRRGKKGDADTLANFKEEDSNLLYQNMSLNQLREMVEERLNAGEEMDSIKIDLRLNGIDVFEVLKEEVKLQEEVGLEVNRNSFLVGMVTRQVEQKGIDPRRIRPEGKGESDPAKWKDETGKDVSLTEDYIKLFKMLK